MRNRIKRLGRALLDVPLCYPLAFMGSSTVFLLCISVLTAFLHGIVTGIVFCRVVCAYFDVPESAATRRP